MSRAPLWRRKTRLLASFLFVLLAACQPQPRELAFSGESLGTTYKVKVARFDGQAPAERFPARIAEVLDELDHKLSTYKSESELNRLGRQPLGEPFVASDDLYRVLEISRLVHQLSDGAFDPTVRPLVDLWGFGPVPTGDRIPADDEIAALRDRIGFDKIELQPPNRVIRRGEVTLDLSAVAKGFIVDRVAAELLAMGASDFMVEIGGEVWVNGRRGDGAPWRIAVEVPRVEGGVERVLEVADIGLATSGDYRNYFERDGVRYSHTIDPRTGKPITHRLASATVLAATTAEADAIATALMVMGPEAGARWAAAHGLAVLLLVHDGEDFVEVPSEPMRRYLDQPR